MTKATHHASPFLLPGWWPAISDTHGHDDVAVFEVVGGIFGAHLAGGLGVLELKADLTGIAGGLEEVNEVGGIEADDEGVEGVGGFDDVFRLSGFCRGGGDLHFVLLETHLDGAGALVGELGDALNGTHEVFAANDGELVVVAWQDRFVIGKLAGELARGEGAVTDTEKEGVVIVGVFKGFVFGVREQGLKLGECLAWDEGLLFAVDIGQRFAGFLNVGETVAVGGDHGQALGLKDEQGAVEGVPGFLVGDGEDGF